MWRRKGCMDKLKFVETALKAATALLAAAMAIIKFIGYIDKMQTGAA